MCGQRAEHRIAHIRQSFVISKIARTDQRMPALSSPPSTNCLAKLAACVEGIKTKSASGAASLTRCCEAAHG